MAAGCRVLYGGAGAVFVAVAAPASLDLCIDADDIATFVDEGATTAAREDVDTVDEAGPAQASVVAPHVEQTPLGVPFGSEFVVLGALHSPALPESEFRPTDCEKLPGTIDFESGASEAWCVEDCVSRHAHPEKGKVLLDQSGDHLDSP